MAKINTIRQSSLVDDRIYSVVPTIIGCGAIGSHLAIMLAKFGISNMILYDDDIVEDVNLSSQGFALEHLGMRKVDAVLAEISRWGAKAETVCQRVTSDSILRSDKKSCFFLCVDSIDARKEILTALNSSIYGLVIDGRMGGETFNVFSFTRGCAHEYEETLNKKARTDACTSKSTIYCASVIAGIMVNRMKTFYPQVADGLQLPSMVRTDGLVGDTVFVFIQ